MVVVVKERRKAFRRNHYITQEKTGWWFNSLTMVVVSLIWLHLHSVSNLAPQWPPPLLAGWFVVSRVLIVVHTFSMTTAALLAVKSKKHVHMHICTYIWSMNYEEFFFPKVLLGWRTSYYHFLCSLQWVSEVHAPSFLDPLFYDAAGGK